MLEPLVDLMRSRILLSHVINADETPVPVLDPTRNSAQKSYLWTYLGDSDHPYTVFDYRDSRNRDGPSEILKNYRGYLQTDAYTCYESVVLRSNGRIVPVGCWAHVRRGFFDARASQPREAHYALSLIGQLYDIEDEFRKRTPTDAWPRDRSRACRCLIESRRFSTSKHQAPTQESVWESDRLCPESMGIVAAIHGGRPAGDRQQHFGADAAPRGNRPQELAIFWK